MNKNHLYANALNLIPEIGAKRLSKLHRFFPDLETAWVAPAPELHQAGLKEKLAEKIVYTRKKIDPEKEFIKLQKNQITTILFSDKNYPLLLKETPDPPAILYAKGEFNSTTQLTIAVVGSRKVTAYGKQVCQDLISGLVISNLTIVSGLALGIDSLAHETVLKIKGETVAVLASGLDLIHPASNRILAQRMTEEGGALLSEFPLGTPPLKHHFPFRNRIIAGLSLGTLIIEAGLPSGALITANHALDYGREVFAVPGSIYSPQSTGTNELIRKGAVLVKTEQDVLSELNLAKISSQLVIKEIVGDNEEETKILKILSEQKKHIDEIKKTSGLSSAIVNATLIILELKGKIKNLHRDYYVIAKNYEQ